MTTNQRKLRLHFPMRVDEKGLHDGDSSKNGKRFLLKEMSTYKGGHFYYSFNFRLDSSSPELPCNSKLLFWIRQFFRLLKSTIAIFAREWQPNDFYQFA